MPAWFYMLRLKSGRLYPGATTDLARRYRQHCEGKACRTTRLDPAVSVVYAEQHVSFSDARRREGQIKGWSHAKKQALVAADKATLKALARCRASRPNRLPGD